MLRSMKILIDLPVTVQEDNVDAIFMAINITITSYTKYVNIKYKYVNEHVNNKVVRNVFAKSAECNSSILMRKTQRAW